MMPDVSQRLVAAAATPFVDGWTGEGTFPNLRISLQILLTIAVSIATFERSFSKLKLILTYLRASMGQDSLSDLALLSIWKRNGGQNRLWYYNWSVHCYEGKKNSSVIFCRHVTVRSANGCCLAVLELLIAPILRQANATFDFFE